MNKVEMPIPLGKGDPPSLFEQYKQLANLELETTKLRLATFAGILSVSFILPGLALKPEVESQASPLPWLRGLTISKAVFLLGFLFYLFALFYYAWHHRYSHLYRKRLKAIEKQLGIHVYRLRVRPKIGRFKLHFDWALQMIALVYAIITAAYVGWWIFLAALGIVLGAYGLRMLISAVEADEPLET
jgi:hypothetical protein